MMASLSGVYVHYVTDGVLLFRSMKKWNTAIDYRFTHIDDELFNTAKYHCLSL